VTMSDDVSEDEEDEVRRLRKELKRKCNELASKHQELENRDEGILEMEMKARQWAEDFRSTDKEVISHLMSMNRGMSLRLDRSEDHYKEEIGLVREQMEESHRARGVDIEERAREYDERLSDVKEFFQEKKRCMGNEFAAKARAYESKLREARSAAGKKAAEQELEIANLKRRIEVESSEAKKKMKAATVRIAVLVIQNHLLARRGRTLESTNADESMLNAKIKEESEYEEKKDEEGDE